MGDFTAEFNHLLINERDGPRSLYRDHRNLPAGGWAGGATTGDGCLEQVIITNLHLRKSKAVLFFTRDYL